MLRNRKMKFLIVLSVLAVASASPVPQDESVFRLFLGNMLQCIKSGTGLCLKEQALRATERLGTLRALQLTEGIKILNNAPKEARSLELSIEPEERKRQVTAKLWESAQELLNNSDLELSFDAGDDNEGDSTALQEGRGKKKEKKAKIKLLLGLGLLAGAKAIALVVGALLVIAASLAKLAILAKIAFIAKVIAIVKALLAKKHHHHEEEVWVPHHEEEHGWAPPHGGHGWDRSRNEGNNLAYSAYSQ